MFAKKNIFVLFFAFFSSFSFANIPKSFSAIYNGYYKGDYVGTLTRDFVKKDNFYYLKSHSIANGYFGFIPVNDERLEKSYFTYNQKTGFFKPFNYEMKRTGTWKDFFMKSNFDYNKNIVSMTYKDRKAIKSIKNLNVLDNALFQLQFQKDSTKKENVSYQIAYKTGFKTFNFKYIGVEYLNTIFGKKTKVLKYEEIKNKKNVTIVWFSPEHNNILVKLKRLNDEGKDEADFILKSYK